MRTNVKEHQAQPKKQETKKASANMSEQKNQSTSSKMDSSNKGKGPKGENL
jgi:hypothetical protein